MRWETGAMVITMTDDDLKTTDEPMNEILTGETHLEPAFRPEWENSNPEWEDGQILLEGELDFPADQPALEVAESLRDRAEIIGAIVSHNPEAGKIHAYPWNGPGYFRLNYDSDDPEARVASVTVFDGQDRPASHETLEDLREKGELSAKLKAAITPSEDDDGQQSDVFRITTDGLVPISDADE